MAIDRYNTTIDRDEVEDRISELEEEKGYDVVRLRNDEVLKTFDDEDDARQYIEDEDYNPERVTVRQQELDSDDAEELSNLRELLNDVGNYQRGDWTIINEDYFSEAWARDEAASELGISSYQLDNWPLSLIDWSDAASEQRESRYPNEYTFDGQTFYGEEE
jgi:hypothetical protein